ncbi:MAG TPA: hypothetical protein VGK88_06940 [bacterium]
MRYLLAVLCALGLLAGPVAGAAAPRAAGALAVLDLTHTLDDGALVINGVIENRGPAVTGLVIDAEGFSTQGNEVVAGSDGIPWTMPAGGRERFSIRLPFQKTLVREYAVQVALAKPPYAPLAGARRSVDLVLYRPFILAQVQLRADLAAGWLIVTSRAAGLPVLQVTGDVTVLFVLRRGTRLRTLTVTVPADDALTVPLGTDAVSVAAVRVTDVLLKVSW